MKDTIFKMIENGFGGFAGQMNDISNMITKDPQAFNPRVWSVITSIYNVLLPVSYSLLALFFLLEFLNKTIQVENFKWETVVKILLKLVVAKMVIENAFGFLGVIFSVTSSIINDTNTAAANMMPNLDMVDTMKSQVEGMGWFQQLGFVVSLSPFWIIMLGSKLVISLIVYGRMMEIYLLTAVSPLPIATLANDELQNTSKRFFQTYIAVCLQGLIIMVGCKIYGGIVAGISVSGDIFNIMTNMALASLVLLLFLVKSSQWSKQISGVV